MEFVTDNWPQIIAGISLLINGATIFAKITENKVDNVVVKSLRKIVDIFVIHTKTTKEKENK